MSARTTLAIALAICGLPLVAPSSAQALEIKNIRPCYGHLGVFRDNAKFLPGDYLFISYEIDGLKLEEKTNKASYIILLEVFDSGNKSIFRKETPNVAIPQLGGSRIPGDLHVIMGVEQAPGKYVVRLTVRDVFGKENKDFVYPFELLPRGFGVVGISALAVGFPSQQYMFQYTVVELGLDAATKKPNAKVEMKILDDAGKVVSPKIEQTYPADLPETFDAKKGNFIPIDMPIFINRAGRFVIEVVVTDNTNKKTATVRCPLTVLDLATVTGK